MSAAMRNIIPNEWRIYGMPSNGINTCCLDLGWVQPYKKVKDQKDNKYIIYIIREYILL